MTPEVTVPRACIRGLAAAGIATACILAAPSFARAADLTELQQKVQETSATYDAAEEKLQSIQSQIDANQQRIEEIQQQLPEKQAAASESIRTLYKMQQSSNGILDLLFSSDDFNSLISTIQYLDVIQSRRYSAVNELVSLTQELKQTESDLATQKAAAESEVSEAQDAMNEAISARTALEEQIAAQLAAEEAERQAAIEAAKAAEGQTFETASGTEATVEVAEDVNTDSSSSDSGSASSSSSLAVDWSIGKEAFVSTWGSRIDAFLAGSPLAGQGTTFAEAAWAYGVDPRFSPAISAVESSQGRYCFKSHNAWGWGSSSWGSWEEAIWAHVSGLASGYGGTLTWAGAQKYCPPTAANWYSSVLYYMESI